jgi:5-methylcytosine-specific restriction endonuclease McrA
MSYYAEHREERLAYQKARYATKAATLIAYQRAWKKANPEKAKAHSRRYYENNAARENARDKARREANPEKERARKRLYAVTHPENVRERDARRRAQKHGTRVERIDFKKILRDANGLCGICGRPFDLFGIHFDHKIPLARGGAHITANIQATHARCNLAKWAKVG